MLASSGVRLGGLNLKWGDLTPVYRAGDHLTADPGEGGEVVCAALSVYAGSPDSYTAFVMPEAYGAILEYGRMWADLVLRQPGPEDPLFLATKMAPRRASEQALAKRVRQMATKAGLREQDSKSGTRFDTQLVHGFRKFFNKTCRETLSGDSLASLIRAEYMMGHRGLVALDQNYFETDVLEMAAEYLNVVPDLTIDDAGRLKQSNRRMADNIQKMEGEKDNKIARMREEMARMGRAKGEEMARMREEIAGLKRRRDFPISGVLDALRESPETDGVPAEVLKSLTEMMGSWESSRRTRYGRSGPSTTPRSGTCGAGWTAWPGRGAPGATRWPDPGGGRTRTMKICAAPDRTTATRSRVRPGRPV